MKNTLVGTHIPGTPILAQMHFYIIIREDAKTIMTSYVYNSYVGTKSGRPYQLMPPPPIVFPCLLAMAASDYLLVLVGGYYGRL